jgi:hypothetical protein
LALEICRRLEITDLITQYLQNILTSRKNTLLMSSQTMPEAPVVHDRQLSAARIGSFSLSLRW